MTYNEAKEYLARANRAFCKPGLDRVSELCDRLGSPERELKIIHVAGTNGKGSFTKMLSAALTASGYRTGCFTSPYIRHFNERIMIDGEMISEDKLAEYTDRVRAVAESMPDMPTEFELLVAICFLYFYESKCDYAVIEAGLGGRGDATNIIESPILSVITSVSIDHTNFLGDTVEKIAYEKAGIIKSAPVLLGGDNSSAYSVVKSVAASHGVDLFTVNYDNIKDVRADISGTAFSYSDIRNIKLSLLGLYQIKNAALVIEAVKILISLNVNIPERALREALFKTRFEGRFERLSDNPTFIFDGAHNADGIRMATQTVEHYFGRGRAVIISGVLADKEYNIIAENIARVASFVYTITPNNPRALTADEYSNILRSYGVSAESTPSVKDAVALALARAKRENAPVITLGSLYTYSEIVDALEGHKCQ